MYTTANVFRFRSLRDDQNARIPGAFLRQHNETWNTPAWYRSSPGLLPIMHNGI